MKQQKSASLDLEATSIYFMGQMEKYVDQNRRLLGCGWYGSDSQQRRTDMDYKELSRVIRELSEIYGLADEVASQLMLAASTSITDLLARAEAAEAANSQLNGTVTTLMESNRKLAEELKEHMETDLAKAHDALSADWAKQKQRAKAEDARAEKAEMERDAAVKYIRHYGWCAGCKHFRGVRGCAGPGLKNCTEQNDHYEFGQKEE